MKLTKKQKWALHLLTDKFTKSIGYGGAAGGGKTWIGCYWLLLMCSLFPETRWFIGRDSLKDTRESVLITWRKVAKILRRTDWHYSENAIKFDNGSEIVFIDLSYFPQLDPLYERFGSKEYTGGWIEEAGNVHTMAFEILKLRINRHLNKEYDILGKILVTFNPKKNWLLHTFYRPFLKKEERLDTKFVFALPTDNPFLPEEYLENLRNTKDRATRERMLYGNFDYDDDPTCLTSYEDISNIWTNTHVEMNYQDKCIICDVARFGSDSAIIAVFYGLRLVEYYVFETSSTVQIQNCINAMRRKHGIPASRCVADEDGVGGGVVDNCGIVGFRNGSSPSDKAYAILKDECGYKLAEVLSGIYFEADVNEETKERIEEELAQLKTWKSDNDNRLRIMPKIKIKENIGRSPDWLDIFIMRMFLIIYNTAIPNEAYQRALLYV